MVEESRTESAEKKQGALGYVDIGYYVRTAILNIWIIILVAIGGTGATYAAIKAQPEIYEAHTSAIVSPRTGTDLTATLQSLDVLRLNVIGTYVQILSSQSVARGAQETLKDRFPLHDLKAAKLEIRPVENSSVIWVLVRSENPELAQELSKQIAMQTIELNPVEALQQVYPIKILDEAQLPTKPVSPDIAFGLLMGGGASLIAGIGLAFLFDALVKDRQQQGKSPIPSGWIKRLFPSRKA